MDRVELPGGKQPLLGVFALEALGLELHLRKERLRPLPDGAEHTYLTTLQSG